MKTDRERKLDKVKKCLRLAKSSNEHEAAAALRQARKMMDDIGVDADDVAASEAAEARARSQAMREPPSWEQTLAVAVAEAIGCGVYFSTGFDLGPLKKPGQYVFVGCGGDQAIASYAFVVLHRQLKRARLQYLQTALARCRRATQKKRADSFCEGWVYSVRRKVGALAMSSERSTAIVAYMSALALERSDPKPSARSDIRYNDFNSGYHAGRDVDLRRPVAGGSGPPAALFAESKDAG